MIPSITTIKIIIITIAIITKDQRVARYHGVIRNVYFCVPCKLMDRSANFISICHFISCPVSYRTFHSLFITIYITWCIYKVIHNLWILMQEMISKVSVIKEVHNKHVSNFGQLQSNDRLKLKTGGRFI